MLLLGENVKRLIICCDYSDNSERALVETKMFERIECVYPYIRTYTATYVYLYIWHIWPLSSHIQLKLCYRPVIGMGKWAWKYKPALNWPNMLLTTDEYATVCWRLISELLSGKTDVHVRAVKAVNWKPPACFNSRRPSWRFPFPLSIAAQLQSLARFSVTQTYIV